MLILCAYKKLSLKAKKYSINLFVSKNKAKKDDILGKGISHIKKRIKIAKKKIFLINKLFQELNIGINL